MPETLTFDISYLYEDSVEGIAIPVTLISGGGIYRAAAKVDPGAEVCLFSREAGERDSQTAGIVDGITRLFRPRSHYPDLRDCDGQCNLLR